MFCLFFSLALALFTGSWYLYDFQEISVLVKTPIASVVEISTSLFNNVDTPVTNVDGLVGMFHGAPYFLNLVAFIIALVVTIGVVMVTIKAVRSVFRVFLGGRLS